MRVKVNGTWYDSNETPVCIQVNESEQKQISEIDRDRAPKGKYAIVPDNWTEEESREFMKD